MNFLCTYSPVFGFLTEQFTMWIALEATGSSDQFPRLLHHNVCISISTQLPLWSTADHAVTTCVHSPFLRAQKCAQLRKKKKKMTSSLLIGKPGV